MEEDHASVVRVLAKLGVALDYGGEESLAYTAAYCGHSSVLRVLAEFDVDLADQRPDPPIIAALENGHVEAAETLVLLGAPAEVIELSYEEETLECILALREWATDVEKQHSAFLSTFLLGVSARGEDHALAVLGGKEEALATIAGFAEIHVAKELTRVRAMQRQLALLLPEQVVLAGGV